MKKAGSKTRFFNYNKDLRLHSDLVTQPLVFLPVRTLQGERQVDLLL
jgi:hypothetical protein